MVRPFAYRIILEVFHGLFTTCYPKIEELVVHRHSFENEGLESSQALQQPCNGARRGGAVTEEQRKKGSQNGPSGCKPVTFFGIRILGWVCIEIGRPPQNRLEEAK